MSWRTECMQAGMFIAASLSKVAYSSNEAGTLALFARKIGGPGNADFTGAATRLILAEGVAPDTIGNVFVTESEDNTVLKIAPASVVSTLAGSAGVLCGADGTGTTASFNCQSGMANDEAGNIYVADTRPLAPPIVIGPSSDATPGRTHKEATVESHVHSCRFPQRR